MTVQNAEINEIYNFFYSTDWPLVNILVKSVRCLNLFFGSAPKWSNPHMACVSYWSQIFKNRLFHGKFPWKDVVRFVCIHNSLYKVNLKRFLSFKVVREDVEKLKTVVDDLYIAAGGVGDPQNFDKSPPSWMPNRETCLF